MAPAAAELPDPAAAGRVRTLEFFLRLVRQENRRNSVRDLFRGTTELLARRVTEQASRSGEHYITASRSEFVAMYRAAAGADLAAEVSRTQCVSIAGNVTITMLTAFAIALIAAQFLGWQSADPGKAAHLLHDLHPWQSLALKVALRSRGITPEQTEGLWGRVLQRFLARPRDFFWPPAEELHVTGE